MRATVVKMRKNILFQHKNDVRLRARQHSRFHVKVKKRKMLDSRSM